MKITIPCILKVLDEENISKIPLWKGSSKNFFLTHHTLLALTPQIGEPMWRLLVTKHV